ncbi:hypothetical protein Hanom_Chr06g00524501 [Helianthus anomalus]
MTDYDARITIHTYRNYIIIAFSISSLPSKLVNTQTNKYIYTCIRCYICILVTVGMMVYTFQKLFFKDMKHRDQNGNLL